MSRSLTERRSLLKPGLCRAVKLGKLLRHFNKKTPGDVMRLPLYCLLTGLTVMISPAMGAPLSEADSTWINEFADKMEATCAQRFDQAEAKLADKTGWQGDRAREMMAAERRVNCGCLPTRIRVRATPEVVAALKERNVGVGRAFMAEQAKACGAQGLRDSARTNCLATEQEVAFEALHGRKPAEGDTEPVPALTAANERTCACYAEAVGALDDATIIAEAEAAYANFRARVENPDTPRHQGRMENLLNDCRQRAGQ